MKSLTMNFIKRAVLIPLIAAVLVSIFVMLASPRIIAKTAPASDSGSATINIADYTFKGYTKFSQLENGNLVGTIKCDDINMGERAILFSKSEKNNIVMDKISTEPWKNGSVMLIGSNTGEQFKSLHDASKGNVFTVSFYDNNAYNYKLKKVIVCETEENLSSHLAPNRLVICMPFNDFTDLGNSYYYRVLIAEMI